MSAIRSMLAPLASVLRGGTRLTVDAASLVRGDIVLLEQGDKVPADLRLIQSRALRIKEAVLTGESVPIKRQKIQRVTCSQFVRWILTVNINCNQNTSTPPHRIIGYDAAGVAEAVGAEVTLFQPGDDVFYAGEFMHPGSNAEYQLVDERLTGRKPSSLGFADAAALPLITITAWEILFDGYKLKESDGTGKDGS